MSVKVTVTGPNCAEEIHSAICKDLNNRRKFPHPEFDFWTLEVASLHNLAIETMGDIATDTTDEDSTEWHIECDDLFRMTYRVMPCVPKLS